jgi:RNA polymerase sigma-70 factor (ECF subfamily)
VAHDAFVRRLARTLVRDAHAAEDLGQDVWVASLQQREEVREPRRWLAGTLRRTWSRSLRGAQHREDRERAAARPEAGDPLTDVLEREEARRRLLDALAKLAEPYRSALLLRYFEGLPPRRIARRLGLPVETVKTHLKRGVALLREQLGNESTAGGDARGAWIAALTPLARGAGDAPLMPGAPRSPGGPTPLEFVIMSTKAKFAVTGVAFLGIVLVATYLGHDAPTRGAEPERVEPHSGAAHELAAVDLRGGTDLSAADTPGPERVVAPQAAPSGDQDDAPTHGGLHARVLWHDGSPAADVAVDVIAWGMPSPRSNAFETTTDANGLILLERVLPGGVTLHGTRGGYVKGTVAAGEVTELLLQLARGFDVVGTVVDGDGGPMPDADIVLSTMNPDSARYVAHSDARGAFRIRSVDGLAWVSARAPGYAPSPMPTITGAEGATVPVELVLDVLGGEVRGRVLDPAGAPVAGATVYVGTPQKRRGSAWAPGPLRSTTDGDGRFRERRVAPGACQVVVRAAGFAPWRGTVEVLERGTAGLDARLVEGVAVHGVARDAAGLPAPKVAVSVDSEWPFEQMVGTGADGGFRLADLAPGAFTVRADGGERGIAEAALEGAPGESLAWSFVLAKLALAGRAVDASGAPLAGWGIRAESFTDGDRHDRWATTDDDGRFLVKGCRDAGYRLELQAPGSFHGSMTLDDVRPPAEDLEFRVPFERIPSARIVGAVVDAAGRPAGTAAISPVNPLYNTSPIVHVDAAGRFEVGPLQPGIWGLRIDAADRPPVRVAARELATGETWDVGTLDIDARGSLRARLVRAPGAPQGEPAVSLRYEGGRVSDLLERDGDEIGATALAPGAYVLIVEGEGFAAVLRRFDVRDGERTTFDIALRGGVSCSVHAALGVGARTAVLAVTDADGRQVVDRWLWAAEGGDTTADICLAPGAYRVALETPEGHRAEGNLDVPSDPVRTPELALSLVN